MRKLPRRPELRSGRAGNDECSLEHRIYAPFPTQSQEVVRRQRQRLVELVHRLGPRVVYELIDHLDRDHGLGLISTACSNASPGSTPRSCARSAATGSPRCMSSGAPDDGRRVF